MQAVRPLSSLLSRALKLVVGSISQNKRSLCLSSRAARQHLDCNRASNVGPQAKGDYHFAHFNGVNSWFRDIFSSLWRRGWNIRAKHVGRWRDPEKGRLEMLTLSIRSSLRQLCNRAQRSESIDWLLIVQWFLSCNTYGFANMMAFLYCREITYHHLHVFDFSMALCSGTSSQ